MDKIFTEVVFTQGIFCILFVYQYYDNKKESREREQRAQDREEKLQKVIFNNQEIMQEMADKFNTVEDIKEDVKEIKNKLEKVGN